MQQSHLQASWRLHIGRPRISPAVRRAWDGKIGLIRFVCSDLFAQICLLPYRVLTMTLNNNCESEVLVKVKCTCMYEQIVERLR
jgi:hypothetical protein